MQESELKFKISRIFTLSGETLTNRLLDPNNQTMQAFVGLHFKNRN